MATKVIIDCDPGIDDAVALTMALFDPRLDVLAITPTAGSVDADQATANVQAILNQLDPPRYPRIARAVLPEDASVIDDRDLHGRDGLGDFAVNATERQHTATSDKVIADLIRQYPNEISIICLGPLTNIARAFQRDPQVAKLVDKLVISGGAVSCSGNVTAAAEWNMYFDPPAARAVFHSATTKTLVPLDVTNKVTFGVDLVEKISNSTSRAGVLLHKLLQHAFRVSRMKLGREVIPLQDAVALLAVLEPTLFECQEFPGDVETSGDITRGVTIFDRRERVSEQSNMEVAMDIDRDEARNQIVRGLRFAIQATK
ncbi:Pyrimidine-specific ribonucleoside hydrolase RihA [Roseimaritima multifibrata]|uniref:Pyrimidine-specific ribonucleoside hydrolase RihA n=1 Tax=Roseimaritima multifibrata TaxID=1930274 RepID=A0A517MEX6_9BACT|nr:nucleoside hydrolase [Roseimaritima multifibrata]QDS93440.1 Pyrimidine-specific ribonucleoside hydrolase RihA [Roseimaritima multifibrata]